MSGTSVPSPSFTDAGFVAPPESAVLAGVQADINGAFGGKLNFTTTSGAQTNGTPQAQLATTEAAVIGDVNNTILSVIKNVDPAFSSGRMQDGIARIYYLTRLAALPTILQVACSGLTGVTISVDSIIADQSGNQYFCTQAGTIPSSGSVTLPFQCITTGPIPVPAASGVSIYQAIPGWDSATVVSGVVGRAVESRAAFELRRSQSVAKNSQAMVDSMLGTVLAVPGVVDAYVVDNPLPIAATVGGVSLAAKSIYVCVAGSYSSAAVAQAIWTKKSPGCGYTGTTSVTVTDPNTFYTTPPSYTVSFTEAVSTEIFLSVSIKNSTLAPSDSQTQIASAISSAFAGTDGGTVPRIGTEILASRFYSAIAALGPWAQIVQVQLGSINTPAASFTGSISGQTLTVGSVSSGALAIGQFITDVAGAVAAGTQIISGSGSTWTLSTTQTVASEALVAVTPNANTVTMNIDQEPTFGPGNLIFSLV